MRPWRTRMLRILSVYLSTWLANAGCTRVTFSVHEIGSDSPGYRYEGTSRKCRFAVTSDQAAVVVGSVPRLPVIYEPYPDPTEFTQIVGKFRLGEESPGSVYLIGGRYDNDLKVVSANAIQRSDGTAELHVQASLDGWELDLRVIGRPERNGQRFCERVQSLIIGLRSQSLGMSDVRHLLYRGR